MTTASAVALCHVWWCCLAWLLVNKRTPSNTDAVLFGVSCRGDHTEVYSRVFWSSLGKQEEGGEEEEMEEEVKAEEGQSMAEGPEVPL